MSMGLARWLAKQVCYRNDLPEVFGDSKIVVNRSLLSTYLMFCFFVGLCGFVIIDYWTKYVLVWLHSLQIYHYVEFVESVMFIGGLYLTLFKPAFLVRRIVKEGLKNVDNLEVASKKVDLLYSPVVEVEEGDVYGVGEMVG